MVGMAIAEPVQTDVEVEARALAAAGRWNDATALVLRALGPELLSFLIATAGSDTDGHDAFSQCSIDVWRGLPGFRWESSLRAWCYTVARHALRRLQRAPARRRGQPFESDALEALVADVRTRTITMLRTETKDRVRSLRASLPPSDQTLLLLRVDRNLAWREVAQILADEDEVLTEAELVRRAAALRKQFERIKRALRERVTDGEDPAA